MSEYKTITAQRDEAVMEVFHRALKEHAGKPIGEIMRIASAMPAPRFYVSPSVAIKRVSELARGKWRSKYEASKLQYEELLRRWRASGAKNYTALADIVEEPAPSFYLSYITFEQLVYRIMRQRNGRDKKKNS